MLYYTTGCFSLLLLLVWTWRFLYCQERYHQFLLLQEARSDVFFVSEKPHFSFPEFN